VFFAEASQHRSITFYHFVLERHSQICMLAGSSRPENHLAKAACQQDVSVQVQVNAERETAMTTADSAKNPKKGVNQRS
jgi:hypothetical protein